MSSMRHLALIVLLGLAPASAHAQTSSFATARPVTANEIGYALNDWRQLRQSDNYPFATYARFLIANPGWPEEVRMRRAAERQLSRRDDGPTVIAFFAETKPKTGNGWTRYAEALAAQRRYAEANEAAREAWASTDLSSEDEAIVRSRFWQALSVADHDRRVDALLFDKEPQRAHRIVEYATPSRRAAFYARIAMQSRADDAEQRYRTVDETVSRDAGLLMDRLRYLREHLNNVSGAKWLAARPHDFTYRPADPERFYDMLLILARDAYDDRDFAQAYAIASQVDDSFAPNTDMTEQSYGVRDNYTSLTWLAGQAALSGLRRYTDAAREFAKYSRGGRSLQVLTKGLYWAGRAMTHAGRGAEANQYFASAAAYPELFYGQLALERLGRPVPPPGGLPTMLVTPVQRTQFAQNRLAKAVEVVVGQRRDSEATLFVRALSEALGNDSERVLGMELAERIDRPDLGVWIARSARNSGDAFYYRPAFPTYRYNVPSGRDWSLVHGIIRQESSFDPNVVSHAGARGMMQLMPGTARDEARKAGVGYDFSRLTSDASYNVLLGSNHAVRLFSRYDGHYVLALAAYNAGPGNANKWVARYGDPRNPNVDILDWIERIPFMETRGYVQRVIENSVVYDQINPTSQQRASISTLLRKSRPG